MAETQNGPAAPAKSTTTAELRAQYPDLCASLVAEGATAERDRIVGIENLGAQMKGHETLIAEMKADGKTTPEQAAVRIIGAENALRAKQLTGIQDVEAHTGKVAAAPQSDPGLTATVAATTAEGWAAEYGAATPAGAKLRAEFATKEDYVSFKANENKVSILRK